MRKELQEIEIIENYLLGKMSANEKADFEKQLETDASLKQNLEMQKSLIDGLQRMGLKNDLLSAKRSLFMRKVWTWFGAAVLLTAIAFGIYYNSEKEELVEKVEKEINDERAEIKDKGVKNKDKGLRTKVDSVVIMSDSRNEEKVRDEGLTTKEDSLVMLSDSRSEKMKAQVALRSNGALEKSLPDFAEFPVKGFQTFKINSSKANTITGNERTIIEIPANAFETKSEAMVELKLQEFYKLSDMVFANLTTQTKDGQLIETGGMVNIEAYQGAKLKLAEGKSITLKFPFEEKKEGMKTFLGDKDERGIVVWKEQEIQYQKVEYIHTTAKDTFSSDIQFISIRIGDESDRMEKMFATRDEDVKEYLIDHLRLPKLSLKELKGFIYISFVVQSDGKISATEVNSAGNAPVIAYEYLKKTAAELPPIVPYRKNDKYLITQFEIRVDLNKNFESKMLGGEDLQEYYDNLRRERSKMKEASKEDFDKKLEVRNDQIATSLEEGGLLTEDQLRSQTSQYILNSTNLGWINCDRYPFAKNGKSSFNVFERDKGINCSLILHSVRGIVSPTYIKQGNYIFPQLPNKELVSVLAFKTEDKKNYVSYYQTSHNKESHEFEFEPLTKEKLQQITIELNAIRN